MTDFKSMPVNKQFMRILIKPDTWLLNGISLDNAAPHPHVVEGDKYAAIIDTTDLDLELRKYIEECVTQKPLIVVSSHSHGDHTANNYMFEDCPIYMSEVAWEEIKQNRENPNPRMTGWAKGTYTPITVKDGDIIDLGGRQLECIKFCGCHSPSSMVYLDTKYGCLFTGDEFEGGQVLIMGGGPGKSNNCIELYRDNLLDLKRRVDGRATIICPPHNGSAIDILLLDYMIENCERILAGHEGMKDVRSMTFGLNPHGYNIDGFVNDDIRRSEWMGTSIVYSKSRIFYRDVQ